MRRRILAMIISATISLGIVFNINVYVEDIVQDHSEKPIEGIYGTRSVGQIFVAHEDGLSGIAVFFATYGRVNTESMIFKLRSGAELETDIVSLVINARSIRDNQYYGFFFDEIRDSKGKIYYFFLQSPNSTEGNAISAWYSSADVYGEGSAYVGHKPIAGDLCFKTYCRRALSDVLKNLYPRILSDKVFFGTYFSSITVIVLLLVRYMTSRRSH